MFEQITVADLRLINELSGRKYNGNQLKSNASQEEILHFEQIKKKLRNLALKTKAEYNDSYGAFESEVCKGNPIAIGGVAFKRVWAGIFKGADNKQYAAQISFVINPIVHCLDVGFYFGRASGHKLTKEQRRELQSQLKEIGRLLVNEIKNDSELYNVYHSLFDYGFHTSIKNERVTPEEWLRRVEINPCLFRRSQHLKATIKTP